MASIDAKGQPPACHGARAARNAHREDRLLATSPLLGAFAFATTLIECTALMFISKPLAFLLAGAVLATFLLRVAAGPTSLPR